MIQHIAETGRGEGWNSMRWQARKTNKSAQKLYDKIAKRVPSQSEDEFIHYELELLPDAPRIEVLKSGIESTMPNQALDSTSFAGDAHCVAVASGGSGRESA